MKNQRKTEIKVGITVILGLIVFLWILGWAKNFTLTTNEKIVHVKFSNVAGLEIGDDVSVNGVRKGFVKDFEVENNNVIVGLSLSGDVDLKEDAQFALTMLDLMGGKKIDIKPGGSNIRLNYNELQQGVFYADVPMVMSLVGSMQEDLVTSLKDLKVTLSSLNTYLTDKQLNSDLKQSLAGLKEISAKLNIMMDENRESLKIFLDNSIKLTDEAVKFISENKEGIGESIKSLQTVSGKTDSLLTRIIKLTTETTQKENNLGKMLYDEELYSNLKQSMKQLNELTKILIEQLKGEGVNVDANIF